MTNNEAITMKAKMAVIGATCGICSLPEDQLLKRLEDLWFDGFATGGQAVKEVLQSVSGELGKIVAAHLKGDAVLLKSTLDDFCKRHVAIMPEQTSQRTH